MKIKDIFDSAENGTLTYEEFEKAAQSGKAKFADIGEGQYVSKHKYDSEIETLNEQIKQLNETVATREGDLQNLQQKLEDAGNDASRLTSVLNEFDTLKTKYDSDMKAYQDKLSQQSYKFAVKEFANTKKFTSNAAKRDFVQAMESKGLQMDKDTILGAEDFAKAYAEENADAFVVENPDPVDPPKPTPTFIQPTPGGQPPIDQTGGFASAFHFTGVRPIPEENS